MTTYDYDSYSLGGDESAVIYTTTNGAKVISRADTPELWEHFINVRDGLKEIAILDTPTSEKRRGEYIKIDGEGIKAMRLQLSYLSSGNLVPEFKSYLEKVDEILSTYPKE